MNWKDHVVQYPGRFEEQDLGGGLVQHTPSPGKVEQQGTPQNATNFNIMDLAAFEAMLMASEKLANFSRSIVILLRLREKKYRLR